MFRHLSDMKLTLLQLHRNLSGAAAWAAALSTALNGLVIAANDLLLGIKSSVPIVSLVVALLFVFSGLFIGWLGILLRRIGSEVPAGSRAYRTLSRLMALAFVVVALVMLSVLYALYDRIAHGAAIFG